MRNFLAVLLCAAALAFPRKSEAHEGSEDCGLPCDVGQGFLIALPVVYGAAALSTNIGTSVYLLRGQPVPRAWSVSGVILWAPPTLVAATALTLSSVGLASNSDSIRSQSAISFSVSLAGLVFSTASLGLQAYALRHRTAPTEGIQLRGWAPTVDAQRRFAGIATHFVF